MSIPLQLRKGSTSEWSSANPILVKGEIAYNHTDGTVKLGDGSTNWNSLTANALLGQRGDVGSSTVLTGGIHWSIQPSPPPGYLACDGSTVSRLEYPNLSMLPDSFGFDGGIGYFSFMQGGGTNYGYGPGESFASSDQDSMLPMTYNGTYYGKGSGALTSTDEQQFGGTKTVPFTDRWVADWQVPIKWGYKFHKKVVINRYAIFQTAFSDQMSMDSFTFEGSNDGVTYTILDTQTEFFSTHQYAGIPKSVTNTTAYMYYRFNVTQGGRWGNVAASKIALEGVPFAADSTMAQLPALTSRPSGNGTTLYPYIKF